MSVTEIEFADKIPASRIAIKQVREIFIFFVDQSFLNDEIVIYEKTQC